ncbi:hypothetical protein BDA99DRAFT_527978 [Phascolomyces articulosus]|uniref:Uncharacterized protein n=1 Tax=Phascolomyces articulosus TaxID=60185 RepID=A0AAD5JMP7_9FUNG|nr:hypothetical protein BDA99DRAFT_527978 [Phascolomyces articulosus]
MFCKLLLICDYCLLDPIVGISLFIYYIPSMMTVIFIICNVFCSQCIFQLSLWC